MRRKALKLLLLIFVLTLPSALIFKLRYHASREIEINELVGKSYAECESYLGKLTKDDSFYQGGFHYYTYKSDQLKNGGIAQILLSDEIKINHRMQVVEFRVAFFKEKRVTWQKALRLVGLPSENVKALSTHLAHISMSKGYKYTEYKALTLDGIQLAHGNMADKDRYNILDNRGDGWNIYWIEQDPTFSDSPPTLCVEHTIFVN